MAERRSLEEIFGSSAGRKPLDEIFDKNDVKQNSKMDLIDSAASKAKSIRATPRFHDAQIALAKFNEFTNRAINATLFGVPGMINPQIYSPEQSSLSPAAQKIATGIGSVVPIELGVNKAIRAVPKPFMEPEWIKNIAKTAKTAVKGKLTELGQGYSQIFKNNQAVRVGYRTIEAIPRFIREQVGLTGKFRYSLDDLWKAREAMVDKLNKSFYKNRELFEKNKIGQKEIKEAIDKTKGLVLNSLPRASRDEFMALDTAYSAVKNKSKWLLKNNSKGVVNLFRDPLNAERQIELDELSKIVPEVGLMKENALAYISRQRNKIIAKDLLLKAALPAGVGGALGYALSQKAR